MYAPLLILAGIILSPASGDPNLADDIMKKVEECEVFFKKADKSVLDEGGDKFPNIPRDDYFKCKDELDDMKRKYISTVLLGLSFYSEVFPIRLSNGTLVMLPVPSQKKSPSETNNPLSCPWGEGLCLVSKKCASILDDINENKIPSDLLYYKTKYSHCTALLDDLKLKYIRENKVNIELLKRAGELTVQCKEGTVSFSLPKSLEDQNNNLVKSEEQSAKVVSENYSTSKVGETQSEQVSSKYSPDNKLLTKEDLYDKSGKKVMYDNNSASETEIQDINSISYFEENLKAIEKISSNNKNNMDEPGKSNLNPKSEELDGTRSNMHANQIKSTSDVIINDSSSKQNNEKLGDDSNSIMLGDDAEKIMEVVSYREKIVSSNANNGLLDGNFPSSTSNHQSVEGNSKTVYSEESALATPNTLEKHNLENTDSETNINQEHVAPDGLAKHHLVTATPMPEILGDEIYERESDCGAFLNMANRILDERPFESVPYYDKEYAECIGSVDKLKHEYIKRHHVEVTKYKAVFPVVLSTGVEKLVLLPQTNSEQSSPFSQLHRTTLEADSRLGSGQSLVDLEDLVDPDHKDETYLSASYKNRVIMENPAFISNKDFFEYFNQNPLGDSESTLSRFANMLRKNGGHLEKKNGE